ncbi:flagellar hook protein FlgE [Clostridiaceae bacterium M8S5]|nr:flagellar hook protein FlgE [Clostridiaceae bacterium M8S5]
MMRSMYSGVSGLSVHQTKMDVIGNNIANVNTVGYKRAAATFQESFNQVLQSGSAPYAGRGGTNPQQIGLGMKLGSINTIYTQGTAQTTDNPEDMMIDGQGYFMVSIDPKAEEKFYTRAGNFTRDVYGNLVTPNGYRVLGKFIGGDDYAKALGITPGKDLDGIKINKSIMAPASSSVKVEIRGNLDSRTPTTDDRSTPSVDEREYKTDVIVKDSLGNDYKVKLTFRKHTDVNKWHLIDNIEVTDLASGKKLENVKALGGDVEVQFDSSGKLTTATPTFNLEFPDTVVIGASGPKLPGFFGTDSANSKIAIDFSKLKQFSNNSDAKGHDVEVNGQIGRSAGSFTGFNVNDAGQVVVSFANGTNKAIWQIKTAKFDNPMGLVKLGGNLYKSSPNSGQAIIGVPGSSGLGTVKGGRLEMSNVNLSLEFTEMITTQRGFQANSRIITTSDEMLQELTNLKR